MHGGIHGGLAKLLHGIHVRNPAQSSGDEFVVLGAQDNGMHLHGLVRSSVVFDGELALGVRPEVGHQVKLVVADIGKDFQQFVAQVQRERHIVFRVATGIAEHHALVAGTLLFPMAALYAAVDVCALLVQGAQDAAAGSVEHIIGLGIADFPDGVAHRALDVHVGLGLHFAHHHHHAGGTEALAGHLCLRILHQELVQDGVGNLVCHFVGVPFAHRLTSK